MIRTIIISIMFCSTVLYAQNQTEITLQDIEKLEQQYATLKNEHLRKKNEFSYNEDSLEN